MSTNGLLEVEEAVVTFGGITALDGVNLSVPPDQIVGLIGPNGAGKTSLLNAVTGVYRCDRGRVVFQGEDLTGVKPHLIVRKGVGRTFQNIRLFESLTVLEHVAVAFSIHIAGWRNALNRSRTFGDDQRTVLGNVEETLAAFELWERRDSRAAELPYGPQRKLEMVRALATNPSLLLLDEPTAGMTHAESDEVADLIALIRDAGIGVLLIEHNMRFVSRTCDKVVVLNFGKKISEGTPEEIRQDPAVLEAYLGRDDE